MHIIMCSLLTLQNISLVLLNNWCYLNLIENQARHQTCSVIQFGFWSECLTNNTEL